MTRILVLAILVGALQTARPQADRDTAVRLATDTLASVLKVPAGQIRLVRADPVDWPNSSMGCPQPDMAYLPVIIPGFRVTLAVSNKQHEVHVGSGRAIMCDKAADGARPSPAPAIKPGIAAAERAKQHLASTLNIDPDALSVGRVREWRATDSGCAPPDGGTLKGQTFSVELKRGDRSYRYRATPDLAWACK